MDALLEDLSLFDGSDGTLVRPGAVSERGHRGFRFVRLDDESLPAALGLQQGDVVWEVNGIELRSFGEVGRAFEEFDEADGLVARIDRGARTLRRSYRLVPALGER